MCDVYRPCDSNSEIIDLDTDAPRCVGDIRSEWSKFKVKVTGLENVRAWIAPSVSPVNLHFMQSTENHLNAYKIEESNQNPWHIDSPTDSNIFEY